MTKNQRSFAKRVNFGLIYGMSSFGLARNLGMKTIAEWAEDCATVFEAIARTDEHDLSVQDVPFNWDATVDVRRLADFRVDVAGIETAAAHPRAKLLFLTSPNNPDGSLLSQEDLQRLLRFSISSTSFFKASVSLLCSIISSDRRKRVRIVRKS